MKYVKMLGLLAVAASALMAFAASASATTVTDGNTNPYTGTITAIQEDPLTLHGVADVTCQKSHVEGTVQSHGPGVTAKGAINKLSFSECNQHVTVIKNGSLEAHHISGTSDGTLTSSGAEVTVQFTTIFGSVHCVFGTNNTHVGRITAPPNHSSHATLDIDSAPIPVVSGSFLCGSSAEWTGNYTITTPVGLTLDA